MDKKTRKQVLKAQQGELDAVLMYQRLAAKAKTPDMKETFLQLAKDEARHASVFFALSKQTLKPKAFLSKTVVFLRAVFGWKLLLKVISNSEYKAVKKYKSLVEIFPEVISVSDDEHRHGDIVKSLLERI